MLDSGASTNVIPKTVMQQLGLKVTMPYWNICSMDMREVRFLGVVNNLAIRLSMYSNVSILIYVVFIDILDSWVMFLLRKFVGHLGVSL